MSRLILLLAALFSTGAARGAESFRLDEIAPGVFAHEGATELMTAANAGGIANLGAIVGDDAVAVIDTGGSPIEARAFLAALREKTGKPIRYVINTHAHPDHTFGNGAFVAPGVTFVGHKNLPASLAARGDHYLTAFRAAMGEALAGTTIVAPTLLVTDTTTLDLGGREIALKAWKTAHSDCDLTIFDPRSKTLFAGDLLFLRHVPVVDGSLLGFLDVVDELAKIPALRVVAGHGPVPAPWPDALTEQTAYLKRLTGDLRASIKKGETVDAAVKGAAREERGGWKLFEDYNARNATAGFAELEWEN